MALLLEKMVLIVWYIVEWVGELDDWELVVGNRGEVRTDFADHVGVIDGRGGRAEEDNEEKGVEGSRLLIFNVLYHKDRMDVWRWIRLITTIIYDYITDFFLRFGIDGYGEEH